MTKVSIGASMLASASLLLGSSGIVAGPAAPLPKPAQHHFAMKRDGKEITAGGNSFVVKLGAADTEGRYTIQDETWPTSFKVGPHYHKEHAETFYMLDGQLSWTVGGETRIIGAGDLVYIPPNTVHSVFVVGSKPAHVLFIYSPGGYEHNEEREREYTAEQLKQPEIQRKLNKASDFNPVRPQSP